MSLHPELSINTFQLFLRGTNFSQPKSPSKTLSLHTMDVEGDASYIDYETFLDPAFSPISFANTLVTSTNNASDTPLDLSTPLSRVLFDVQEIDTHIHSLTTKSAVPLLTYTKDQTETSEHVLHELETQIAIVNGGYQRLEKEVIQRYEAAEEVQVVATRLWQTVKLGRLVSRCLLLGRQLEAQMSEFKLMTGRNDDHRVMVRASTTLMAIRQLLSTLNPLEDENLSSVRVIQTLQTDVLAPADQRLRNKAQQYIREFSLSPLVSAPSLPLTDASPSINSSASQGPIASTYAQTEESKSRTTSACITLYLLSPSPSPPESSSVNEYVPSLLLNALQTYLQTALAASLASTTRALAALPTLTRTLAEVSARCQNIVALERMLASTSPPHLLVASVRTSTTNENLLMPLLAALDTASLPSFFWRSMASGLTGRVMDMLNRGGIASRNLKVQREKIRESIRDAVLKGVDGAMKDGWDREVGVMVGSVLGPLGR